MKLNIQKTKIHGSITSWQIVPQNKWKQWQILFSWAPKSLWVVITAMKLKDVCSWKESYDKLTQHIKNQRHYFADKSMYGQSCGFASSHVQMWESDHKESWEPNNWCFWTVVLEKTLESPLDCKEIKPINLESTLNIYWKDYCWSWSFNTLATWCKEQAH